MANPSLSELLEQKADLERQIAARQRSERAEAVSQVRTLMAQYGLTLADISSKGQAAPGRRGAGAAKGKVAAKYRDAATGQTWSGRGLQPNWLKAALAAGRKMTDFAL